ncbi:tRNA-specific 2-thiouridylase MnmA [Phycisphaerae bacterium RAS1]|nr:tRNA-specific 2-thiouridylase MnmA [Phycisphaerae bacterium RAS1]
MSNYSRDALSADAALLFDRLIERLGRWHSVIVAFSGGVDSAFVCKAAMMALGGRRVLAVTGRSASVPSAELASVAELAREIGAPHQFLDTHEFADPNYLANPSNRCYFCKTELYSRLARLTRQRGDDAIISGTNADDLGDHRPGLLAAEEHGVRAPLAELGITKARLREMAAAVGLSIARKPASPCLSSRVQYGETITPEKLRRIDAAERYLRGLGFHECRVRNHGELARIEVPLPDVPRLAESSLGMQVEAHLRELGFAYVTVDLRGFRSGSMNEGLPRGVPLPLLGERAVSAPAARG